MSKDQIIEGIKAFDAKGLPPLEPGRDVLHDVAPRLSE